MRRFTDKHGKAISLAACALGMLLSALNLGLPESASCMTDGCAILRSFKIFGMSLWQPALVFFGTGAALTLARPAYAKTFAAIGVVLDIVLLAVMLMAAPCVMCLAAGLLIAVFFAGQALPRHTQFPKILLSVWLVLFIMQGGILVSSLIPGPVMLKNGPGPDIYWSPSCGRCVELMKSGATGNWRPVAENADDAAVIVAMYDVMGKAERLNPRNPLLGAWRLATEHPSENAFRNFLWRILLWKNEARVLSGRGVLPHVEGSDFPASADTGFDLVKFVDSLEPEKK